MRLRLIALSTLLLAPVACSLDGVSVGSIDDAGVSETAQGETSGNSGAAETGDSAAEDTGVETMGASTETGEMALTEEEFWDRVLRAQCGEVYGCGCSSARGPFDDVADCTIFEGRHIQADLEDAHDLGLTFNPECAQRWVDHLETWSCGPASGVEFELMTAEEVCGCSIYEGSAGKGEPCHRFESPNEAESIWFNACEPGLMCNADAQCIPQGPICLEAGIGDGCVLDFRRPDGVIEQRVAECPPAYFCEALSQRCIPRAHLGEACVEAALSGAPCDQGLICSEGQCELRAELGESCEADADCQTWQCDGLSGVCEDEASVCD